jgi:hypothetical protein
MLSTESLDGTSGTEDPLSADPVWVAPVVFCLTHIQYSPWFSGCANYAMLRVWQMKMCRLVEAQMLNEQRSRKSDAR